MQLRRLQLIGFKSFAERTVLEFGPGVTAVVGPNGSGKSNIADAVRWVTGELHARHLRGARLDDVIFAGTERRRQAGWSEVELQLDNEEGRLPVPSAEVTVTRRVDRAGGSEAFINGARCRARDVMDLFAGTGFGPRAYAFVGQGQVETVLDGRPEERRALVEEAAGVTRYRGRVAEAARILQRAGMLTERLAERVREVEARLEPLARQAERARRRERLDEESRRLSLGLLRAEWEEASQRLARVQERAEREREALEEHRREARALQEELARRREAHQAAEAREAEAARQAEAARARLDAARRRLGAAREEVSLKGSERRQAELRAAAAKEACDRLRQELAEEERRLAEARDAAEAARLSGEPARKERAGAEAALAEARRELREAQAQLVEAERDLAASEADARGRETRDREALERLATRAAETERALAEADALVERREEALQAAMAAERAARARLEAAGKAAARAARAADESAKEAAAAERADAEARSRAQVWLDVRASAAGYAEGPRAVLAAWRAGEGELADVVGAVAELIRVPAKLERAIEVALGGAAQDLVTRTADGAERAIGWLKRERAGRATFLPLDALRPQAPGTRERDLASGPGALGWAGDLVKSDELVRPAVEHLLGRVLVAEDLASARRLAAAGGHRVRVVTLEGEVIHPGGAMTGGDMKRRGPGLVGRERTLAEAEAAAREAASALERAREAAARAAAARDAARQAEASAAAVAQDASQARALAERAAAEAAERARASREAAAEARAALARAREAAGAAPPAGLAASATDALERRRATRERADAASARIERAEAALAAADAPALAAAARLAAAAAAVHSAERSLERTAAALAAREREAVALAGTLAAAEAAVAPLREAASRAEEDARQAESAARAAEEAQRTARQERVAAQARLAELDADRASLDEAHQEAAQSAHEAELQVAQAEAKRDSVLARAWELYEVDAAHLARVEPVREPGAASRLAAMRAELSRIGSVDLESVAQYEEERSRHAEMAAALEDLRAAIDGLVALSRALEERMDERFRDTLGAVRHAFRETFRRLFGGGEADLVAVSAAPTEAGGDEATQGSSPDRAGAPGLLIRAQPPGRRTDKLTLLSGGERSLAAIAFLFALLTVQPAPFCVLDEIDAALDEANVGRFGDLLKEMGERTQILIITHQKGTMEAADRLFGVTMSETGVSQVVSVALEHPAATSAP